MSSSKKSNAQLLFAILAPGLLLACSVQESPGLDQISADLVSEHADISHWLPSAIEQRKGEVILLDVREPAEFAVSHIAGAIRVSPDASAQEVADLIDTRARGASILFYCSVGVRSSQLATRAKDALIQKGAAEIANLRGGLFRWHGERRPLVSANGGPTELIHPYDDKWGRLVERGDLAAYAPPR